MRYTFFIFFTDGSAIKENVKSMVEVNKYVDMLDDTVMQSYVTDNITGEIVKYLKDKRTDGKY